MDFTSVPSYFAKPSFGVDTAGAFTGTANSLAASPLASSASSSFKPAGMDPFSVAMGVASIGTSIAGLFGQKSAAEQQAEATAEAAETARRATEKAARMGAQAQLAGKIGGYGFDYLTARYEGGAGSAMNRLNAARDMAQTANLQAHNPSLNLLRSTERFEERLRGAMPGYQPPSALFVG